MTVKELKAILETMDENKNIYVVRKDGVRYTTDLRVDEFPQNVYIEER